MTIQQFIEKAIEGGFLREYFVREGYKAPIMVSRTKDRRRFSIVGSNFFNIGCYMNQWEVLVRPEAWKAVGKVEVWKVHGRPANAIEKMHRMINALAEGKTIEQYLETL